MIKDIKSLITMLFIGIVIIILDLPSFTALLAENNIISTKQNENLNNSDLYKLYTDIDDIWQTLKGDKKDTPLLEITQTDTSTGNTIIVNKNVDLLDPIIGNLELVQARKITTPVTILIVGDSMMIEGFGPQLEADLLKFQGVTVIRQGKYSTGLNRIDYFDWYSTTQNLINTYKPEILICMFGANDGQPIYDYNTESKISMHDNGWKDVYTDRVFDYMSDVTKSVRRVYWVGQPIPATQEFQIKFSLMNEIYKTQSANFKNIIFIDSWDRFAVNGKYSPVVADDNGLKQNVKYSDGVHLTPHGSKILSTLVINQMKQDVELKNK